MKEKSSKKTLKEIERLKNEIENICSNHEKEMQKLKNDGEIAVSELEHQKKLIDLYDKDLLQTKNDLKNLESQIRQDYSRKYSVEISQLEKQIIEEDKILKDLIKKAEDLNLVIPGSNQNYDEITRIVDKSSQISENMAENILNMHTCHDKIEILELQKKLHVLQSNVNEKNLSIKSEHENKEKMDSNVESLVKSIEALNLEISHMRQKKPDLNQDFQSSYQNKNGSSNDEYCLQKIKYFKLIEEKTDNIILLLSEYFKSLEFFKERMENEINIENQMLKFIKMNDEYMHISKENFNTWESSIIKLNKHYENISLKNNIKLPFKMKFNHKLNSENLLNYFIKKLYKHRIDLSKRCQKLVCLTCEYLNRKLDSQYFECISEIISSLNKKDDI